MSKKTKLSLDEVKHVAKLANLKLKNKELKKFQKQLSSILDFVSKLNRVNTNGVEPTSQVTGLENIFREDEVRPSLSQEKVLANAPEAYKGYFKVKAVLEN